MKQFLVVIEDVYNIPGYPLLYHNHNKEFRIFNNLNDAKKWANNRIDYYNETANEKFDEYFRYTIYEVKNNNIFNVDDIVDEG